MIPSREEWIAALVERHGEERQNAFLNATVAICGLGVSLESIRQRVVWRI